MHYAILLDGEHNHNPSDFNDFAEERTKKGGLRRGTEIITDVG